MSAAQLVAVPVLGIGGLALVGTAPAALLKRLPLDIRAALVLPVGAGLLACVSTATLLGAPTRVVGVAVAAASALAVVAARRQVAALGRGLAVPAAVGLAAIYLASIPAVSSGSWDTASAGNADQYFWVSQSRSFLDGPAPAPASVHPDRGPYEWVTKQHGAVGIPFCLSLLSLASEQSPEKVYSAFSALVDVVLALVVYVLGRLALRWTRRRSAVAAVLVAGNAFLLFATFFGWQAQLLLTAFSMLALAGTYAGLEAGPRPDLVAIGALGAAAAICTYGAAFAPFVALGAAVIVAYRALHTGVESRRRVNSAVGAISLLTLFVAGLPLVRGLIMGGWQAGYFSQGSVCSGCQAGLPSESLGLVPRVGEVARASGGWSLLSLAVAAPLYFGGFAGAKRESARAILVWGSAAALAGIVVLALLGPNPYLSIKLAGYATPLLMLTVVAGRPATLRQLPQLGWLATATLAGVLFVVSTGIVELRASQFDLHADAMAGLGGAAHRLPAGTRIEVDVKDAWHQAWALYYLRDRPVTVKYPQYFVSNAIAAAQKRAHTHAHYVVTRGDVLGPVIWSGGGVVLSARAPTGM